MINRLFLLLLAIAAVIALTSCGSSDDDSSPATEPTTAEVAAADTTTTAPTEPAPEEPAADDTAVDDTAVDDTASTDEPAQRADGCDQVLTSDEVESFLGTPVVFNGTGEVCMVIFADDSVGNLQAWSGSKADQAIEALLPQFEANETSVANGVLLDDARGFVLDGSAVVRGDSGRVFRFDAPDNVDVDDVQAAMEGIAELLITR